MLKYSLYNLKKTIYFIKSKLKLTIKFNTNRFIRVTD